MKNYTFLKSPWPMTMPFQICKYFCKILNNLIFYQEKLKNVQITFDRLFAKNSFRECAWGLRQLVLKPSFRPKRRALGMKEKSENFNQNFLSYVKKTTGGGVKLTHPPSKNRVKSAEKSPKKICV